MKNNSSLFIALAIVVAAIVLGGAYRYKYNQQNSVVVTGLGEEEFSSDLIVWRGWIVEENHSAEAGYAALERSKQKIQEFIRSRNIPDSCVVFMFVNVSKSSEPIYSNGNYIGQRFTGYDLRQEFTVESKDVAAVEAASREISSLIAQGVQIESWEPSYYYTKLDGLKLQLIEKASADAHMRAKKIAAESGARLKSVKSARMGVFQITGANANEEFSAGGNYNTTSNRKKARITMRLEYNIK